jgi:hypothetical protein
MSKSAHYLGQERIDIRETNNELVLRYLNAYSHIDGAHHKQWLLDQIARIIMGTPVIFSMAKWDNGKEEIRFSTSYPSTNYLDWIGEDINETDWVGIAP